MEQTRVHVLIYQVHLNRAIQRFSLLAAVLLSVNENGNNNRDNRDHHYASQESPMLTAGPNALHLVVPNATILLREVLWILREVVLYSSIR